MLFVAFLCSHWLPLDKCEDIVVFQDQLCNSYVAQQKDIVAFWNNANEWKLRAISEVRT